MKKSNRRAAAIVRFHSRLDGPDDSVRGVHFPRGKKIARSRSASDASSRPSACDETEATMPMFMSYTDRAIEKARERKDTRERVRRNQNTGRQARAPAKNAGSPDLRPPSPPPPPPDRAIKLTEPSEKRRLTVAQTKHERALEYSFFRSSTRDSIRF